jgi:inner membrane protein YidH
MASSGTGAGTGMDPRQPLDQRDYSRRTLLANERTYLAWWRTGLTSLTVALAAARVVPVLAEATVRWPYTLLGVAFALLGVFCIGYGERRRATVDRAVREGEFADPSATVTLAMTALGVVLGIGMIALILVEG